MRPLRPGGAEGERACAGWAVRSWAKPEVVGRARKWSRGTGLGPREEEEGREVGRGEAGSGWEIGFGFALGFSFFLFLFLFYFLLNLNYLNSKEILNSNPYEIKQLKQCISMNALTKLNLRKFLITCETKARLNARLTQ